MSPLQRKTHRERWLSKARRRAGTAPNAIFANPGPSGPAEIWTGHSDFARRSFCTTYQEGVPRKRGPGKGDYEHGVLIGAVPGGVLVPLPPWAKELAARRRRNSPTIRLTPKSRWRSNPPAFSQKRVSTFLGARDFKMLGGSKFRLRQGFACGKTLVRRVRAAPSAMGPRPKRRKTRVLCWNRFRSYSQIAVAK